VALVILGIEWMTQKHYLESVRDDEVLDLQFKSLLRHHWMEEAQHTKLDTLMVQALTDNRSAKEIDMGISDYWAIGVLIDSGIPQQVEFDLQALQRAAGRNFNEAEQEQFRAIQRQAQRWTYLGSAMTHPQFLQTVGEISPDARTQIEEMSSGRNPGDTRSRKQPGDTGKSLVSSRTLTAVLPGAGVRERVDGLSATRTSRRDAGRRSPLRGHRQAHCRH